VARQHQPHYPALATNNAYELVRLNGSVPLGAISQYGATQVLDLRDAVLSDGRAVRIDDGLHVNAYPGDTSGNGDYDGGDPHRMDRVSSGLDTATAATPWSTRASSPTSTATNCSVPWTGSCSAASSATSATRSQRAHGSQGNHADPGTPRPGGGQ